MVLKESIKTESLVYDWAPSYYESIEYYSFPWDSICKRGIPVFYTFSLKERIENTIVSIGHELTDCSYICLFSLEEKSKNILFSNPFALELDYTNQYRNRPTT